MGRNKNTSSEFIMKVIKPKTENQADFLRSMCENVITICEGCSGTGKSMLSLYLNCCHLLEGKIKNILISRSIVECGKDIGSLPGDVYDKTYIYFSPYIAYLELFLGKKKTEELINNETVKMMPVELLRGHTFVDTGMILDEAQNCSIEQIKLFMSRIGHGSKITIIGDSDQSDTNYSAFKFCINKLSELEEVGVINFTNQDIQRHPIIGKVLEKLKNIKNY